MRLLFIVALTLATVLHISLFAATWPASLLGALNPFREGSAFNPDSLIVGFACGSALMCVARLAKAGRFASLAFVFAVVLGGAMLCSLLPIAKTVSFSPAPMVCIGAFAGIVSTWFLRAFDRAPSDDYVSRPIPWGALFLFSLNIFLVVAPFNHIVPTGIQENSGWSLSSFDLDNKDSVGIRDNLIFVFVRSVLEPLVGHSIFINSLVSMVLCAAGLACFAAGIQNFTSRAAALLALVVMALDGWVLAAAYSANLVVTLIPNAGLMFWILTRILRIPDPQSDRRLSWHVGVALVCANLLALYSYAAVRIPWVVSIAIIGCALVFFGRAPSIWRRSITAVVVVGAPLMVAVTLILAVGYRGDIGALSKHVFVSWPKDSIRAHPGPDGIKDFELIHNPDTPIWKQVARPKNGDNISLIWTRTVGETLSALKDHASRIAQEHPSFFFVPLATFALILTAFVRIPLVESSQKRALFVTALWGMVWVSSFFSVPDVVAYRRGIAFSAIAALAASLALAPRRSARGVSLSIPVVIGLVLALVRAPQQVEFSNNPETRSRLFTVCGNAFAIRSLLTSERVSTLSASALRVVALRTDHPREVSCLSNAVQSNEWQRILPKSSVVIAPDSSTLSSLISATPGDAGVFYCTPDSLREPRARSLCDGTSAVDTVVDVIPVSYGGVANKWVVFRSSSSKSE